MSRRLITRTILTADGRVIQLEDPALVELPLDDVSAALRHETEPKKKRGPRTRPKQAKWEKGLAQLPGGLTVAEQAERLKVSESTIYRARRSKKS